MRGKEEREKERFAKSKRKVSQEIQQLSGYNKLSAHIDRRRRLHLEYIPRIQLWSLFDQVAQRQEQLFTFFSFPLCHSFQFFPLHPSPRLALIWLDYLLLSSGNVIRESVRLGAKRVFARESFFSSLPLVPRGPRLYKRRI